MAGWASTGPEARPGASAAHDPGHCLYYIQEVVTVDWGGITQVIQSLGFPIACVVAMFVMWQREVEAHKAEVDAMNQRIDEMAKATVTALNNNTTILQKILTKIGEV